MQNTFKTFKIRLKYEIKRLKSLQKVEASMMELFCEYTSRFTIFAIKAPSQMFD